MDSNRAWNELKLAARRRPAGILDFLGVSGGRDDDAWTVALNHDWAIEFRGVGEPVRALEAELQRAYALTDAVDRSEVMSEIVRQAAIDVVANEGRAREWSRVMELMNNQMTVAVVALPVAGMYSDVADVEGNAMPVRIGEIGVAGHLDEALESAVDDLAKRHGLVGFRFTRDSWWTEDLITAKGDPQIGQEIMEQYADGEGSPWFVIASRVPSSGVAAEAKGVLSVEALVGALVLLDHPPGHYWREGLPWIPGQLSRMGDPFAPTAPDSPPETQPQIVDGRAQRLEMADSESFMAVAPPELDAGAHLTGPAAGLLAQVLEPERAIAGACRLALHAAATWSPEAKRALAAAAARVMLGVIEIHDASGYIRAITEGVRWRAAHQNGWPRQHGERKHKLDVQRWHLGLPGYEEHLAALDPTSASDSDGHRLLDATQALLFERCSSLANYR